MIRRFAASFLLICFLVFPIVAQVTVQKPTFTLSLPYGWIEIPQDVLSAVHEELQKQAPNAKIPDYDYGFQLASSKNWLECPYVLVQINNAGRIPKHQLKSMPKIDLNEKLRDTTSAFKSLMSNVTLGQMQYDEAAHIIWLTIQSDVAGIGKVWGISGSIPTEKGSVQIHAYALESNFQDYLSTFRQLITSTKISAELAYKPHWTDNVHPLLNSAVFNAILGGLAGILIALLAVTKRKKSWMSIWQLEAETTSTVPLATVSQRVSDYLQSRGYQQTTTMPTMRFKRGSLFGSMTSLSPTKWAVFVTVHFPTDSTPNRYEILLEINTTGQSVTASERNFWQQEQAGLIASIEDRTAPPMQPIETAIAQFGKIAVKLIIIYSLIGAFAFLLAALMLHSIGVEPSQGFTGIGAGLGAGFGFQQAIGKHNKAIRTDTKKN